MDEYMLFNAFPQSAKQPIAKRVELCRFTSSGTFDPAQYPTEDGLYDVYIVGGGGGGFSYHSSGASTGGGGGYAKLLKNLTVSDVVNVVIGSGGEGGYRSTSGVEEESPTNGGTTKFGTYGSAEGGKASGAYSGGDGGCGGAGLGGTFGGINGKDGTEGTLQYYRSYDTYDFSGSGGTGGGNTTFCPRNPYDGQFYGVGGNATNQISSGESNTSLGFPAINDNFGRGGTGYSISALSGGCIIYGISIMEDEQT